MAPAHLPPESALEHFFDLRLIETKIRSCSLRQAREKVGNAAAAVRKQLRLEEVLHTLPSVSPPALLRSVPQESRAESVADQSAQLGEKRQCFRIS